MSDKMSIDQILELLYDKVMEPHEAKELLSNLVDDELSDDGCKCIRFTGSGKEKQTCKNCKFNNEQYCTVGTHYAEKGLNKICYEGELWEGK